MEADKFLEIVDTFTTLVHNQVFPEADKLGKLCQAISADTGPLAGGPYTGSYQEVWKGLNKPYDWSRQMGDIHLMRFLNIEAVRKESFQGVLAVIDAMQTILRTL